MIELLIMGWMALENSEEIEGEEEEQEDSPEDEEY